jgi:hypothetical protein
MGIIRVSLFCVVDLISLGICCLYLYQYHVCFNTCSSNPLSLLDAPSIFTDKKYSPAHLETVKSMTSSLNTSIRTCIENLRALNFDNVMWQSIFEFGSLTSANSEDIGLVDVIPPVDPLLSLLNVNKKEAKKKEKKKKPFMSRLSANEEDDNDEEDAKKTKGDEECVCVEGTVQLM